MDFINIKMYTEIMKQLKWASQIHMPDTAKLDDQHTAAEMIPSLRNKPYEERCCV